MSAVAEETISIQQYSEVMSRAETNMLTSDDVCLLRFVGNSLFMYQDKLNEKDITIEILRKYVFGSTSEKRNKNTNKTNGNDKGNKNDKSNLKKKKKRKKKGTGRNGKLGADEYAGAQTVAVPHDSLCPGDCCPNCSNGKVYGLAPSKEIRLYGLAPIGATKYELEQLRCNLCQTYFKADLPEEAGKDKFLPSAVTILSMMKYNMGLPLYRIAKLQRAFKIPISESTQWGELNKAYDSGVSAIFKELQRASAQSHTIHIDDTTMRILEMMGERRKDYLEKNPGTKRKGIYTTGHVCISDSYIGIVFKSGINHAGENLDKLMVYRNPALPKPLVMSDALPCNTSGFFKPIFLFCLSHARRKFEEIENYYPVECEYILDLYAKIYINDDWAKQSDMSDIERMEYHFDHSKPIMEELHRYLTEKKPFHEPRTRFYKAIQYHFNHWEELNKFYTIPGAPIDNNICEQVLKKPILNRKNALFYKTQRGADVGDAFMSIYHTCEVNNIHPFNYMNAVLSNLDRVSKSPKDWLPWNYHLNDGISTG